MIPRLDKKSLKINRNCYYRKRDGRETGRIPNTTAFHKSWLRQKRSNYLLESSVCAFHVHHRAILPKSCSSRQTETWKRLLFFLFRCMGKEPMACAIHTQQLFVQALFRHRFSTFAERRKKGSHIIQDSFLFPQQPLLHWSIKGDWQNFNLSHQGQLY